MKLANKVSIVTGGGGGIGRAVCLALAQGGADVVVGDIVSQAAKKVSEEIQATGRKSVPFEIDVSKGDQVNEMVKTGLNSFGKIDILVNVAGTHLKSSIEDLSEQDWDRIMAVNLKGTFLCSQAVGREMIKQGGGSIVNFASIAGYTPEINSGAYSPSKAAVVSLTKLMAVEWAKYNVRVNAVGPGPIRTAMLETAFPSEAQRKQRMKSIPMNRLGNPEEVANAVVFLASDECPYITGQVLVIDGGALNSMYYLTGLLAV